jgi:hypothetical protein
MQSKLSKMGKFTYFYQKLPMYYRLTNFTKIYGCNLLKIINHLWILRGLSQIFFFFLKKRKMLDTTHFKHIIFIAKKF